MSDQTASAERMIAARIERLPISGWHIRVSTLLGIAIFFDAFDSLALAYVLPVLAGANPSPDSATTTSATDINESASVR